MAEQPAQAADIIPRREECGLALSGGGIRSATFCLGLLSALAGVADPQHPEQRLLQRFKYLSTVSGGGFTGAMFGRLFQPAAANPGDGWQEVCALLSGENRRLLWWLRKNGRYLTPKGISDGLVALFSLLRGFLATQFEVAMLFAWFGSLVLLPHLLLRENLPCMPGGAAYLAIGAHLGSVWWWLVPLPAFAGLALMWAYWFSRDHHLSIWADWIGALFFGLLPGLWFLHQGYLQLQHELGSSAGESVHFLLPTGFGLALLTSVCGLMLARQRRYVLWPRQARNSFTRRLALCGALGLGLTLLALLDMFSWRLLQLLQGDSGGAYAIGGVGVTSALALLGRLAAPLLQQMLEGHGKRALRIEWLANLLGLTLLAALLLAWFTLAQYLVFADSSQWSLAASGGDKWPETWRWSALFVVPALYLLLSRSHIEQLNLSSLHHFYRGRLASAYVSVGNHDFWGTARGADCGKERGKGRGKVIEEFEHDDVPLAEYRPDAAGGPVHLINVCINQTLDDRTGWYSADRKGIGLAVSSEGLEYGNWAARPGAGNDGRGLTLAQWVAISGAAASSGMGSSTRPGLAALMFLSGMRLGYWLENPLAQEQGNWSWLFRHSGPKYAALLSELFGQFPGVRNPYWYLSDGGHFDNTGVYALLKRRLKLIVLADCGADPQFLFGDVENLIRKAKIDLDADIEFINPGSLPPLCRDLFGAPDSITPEPGAAHLLLAKISYSDKTSGQLLIVKPRRLTALPFDVVGYADRNPNFPQQTTGDQFFDEAQWESYFALGKTLGGSITPDLLALLQAAAPGLTTLSLQTIAAGLQQSDADGKPVEKEPDWLQRRRRVLGTVGATVGIGALIPLALGGWQAWQSSATDASGEQFFYDNYRDTVGRIEQLGAAPTLQDKLQLQARLVQLTMLASTLDQPLAKQSVTNLLQQVREDLRARAGQTPDGIAPAPVASARPAVTRPLPTDGTMPNRDPLTMESLAALGKILDGERGDDGANLRYWLGSGDQQMTCPAQPRLTSLALDLQRSARLLSRMSPTLAGPDVGTDITAPPPLPPKTACSSAGSRPLRLYIQIYDEASRTAAQQEAKRAIARGLLVPGIDNVTATAARQHKAVPQIWDRRTWIFHSDAERNCAKQLAAPQDRWLSLPPALKAAPGVIELWIPPPQH